MSQHIRGLVTAKRTEQALRTRMEEEREEIIKDAKGDPGPKGDKGDVGKDGTGINWRGAWRPGTTYYSAEDNPKKPHHYDAVRHNGSSWLALTTTTERPRTGSPVWDLLAEKGADGKDGKPAAVIVRGGGGGASAPVTVVTGQIDGGNASSVYGGTTPIDGGGVAG